MQSCIELLQPLVLPPGINLLIFLLGFSLLLFQRSIAMTLMSISISSLLILSMPITANYLILSAQNHYHRVVDPKAQAIVVLGGGVVPHVATLNNQPELNTLSLKRLIKAYALHQRTNLPLILSGGGSKQNQNSTAEIMDRTLQHLFNKRADYVEKDSLNTLQNGKYTAHYLRKHGIDHVYVVTDAWHLRRALAVLTRQGLSVTPYPSHYSYVAVRGKLEPYLPKAYALYISQVVIHEWLGYLWYELRYHRYEQTS
jgi:uncharacterized SAM-binding protein YcdF (DUF218 family)